jgi:hypothetical protein
VEVELGHIDPQVSARGCRGCGSENEADLVATGVEPAGTEGVGEGMEGAAQGGMAAGGVKVGPEEVDEGVAAVALGCDGEVGEEREGLAPVQADGGVVELETRRTEQKDSQARHPSTSLMMSILKIVRKVNEIRGRQAGCNGIRDGSATESW